MGDYLNQFWNRLTMVPAIVVNNVPAFFGFAATDYAAAMIINALPVVEGGAGMVERAFLMGGVKVVDFATWDAFKGLSFSS